MNSSEIAYAEKKKFVLYEVCIFCDMEECYSSEHVRQALSLFSASKCFS